MEKSMSTTLTNNNPVLVDVQDDVDEVGVVENSVVEVDVDAEVVQSGACNKETLFEGMVTVVLLTLELTMSMSHGLVGELMPKVIHCGDRFGRNAGDGLEFVANSVVEVDVEVDVDLLAQRIEVLVDVVDVVADARDVFDDETIRIIVVSVVVVVVVVGVVDENGMRVVHVVVDVDVSIACVVVAVDVAYMMGTNKLPITRMM
eukprot:3877564-Amphidinium_carterae.2